jgi:hypothetical protein
MNLELQGNDKRTKWGCKSSAADLGERGRDQPDAIAKIVWQMAVKPAAPDPCRSRPLVSMATRDNGSQSHLGKSRNVDCQRQTVSLVTA